MTANIQALLKQYQQKYPLYTKDNIVDLMLQDGVITIEIAKKIKAGISLFTIENQLPSHKEENSFNSTEIFGGYFTSQTSLPKTNFNGKIEQTFQSEKQGDCWLLSDINTLNETEWGKKAIFEAIKPNPDGSVTIKFKGSPIEQKEFHITAQEIENAKNSGHYSNGDDDMIGFELATEKLSKILVKKGLANRITLFDKLTDHQSYIAGGGVYFENGYTLDISQLITGRNDVEVSFSQETKVPNEVLKFISENAEIACVCTFISDCLVEREEDAPIHGGHAYAVKKIVYGKYAIVIDPYHTDQTIRLPWEYFKNNLQKLNIASQDNKTRENIDNLLPQKLKEEIVESNNSSAEINNRLAKLHIASETAEKFPEVAKTLLSFGFDTEDILFDEINVAWEDGYGNIYCEAKDFETNYRVMKLEHQNSNSKEEPNTNNINKDNVLLLLNIKPDFIGYLDNYKSGWGQGKEKKALIMPIINALIQKAEEEEISNEIIANFKNKCLKELDAKFYTNEKVIIQEIDKLKSLLKPHNK